MRRRRRASTVRRTQARGRRRARADGVTRRRVVRTADAAWIALMPGRCARARRGTMEEQPFDSDAMDDDAADAIDAFEGAEESFDAADNPALAAADEFEGDADSDLGDA